LFREEKEYDTSNLTNELLCATPQIYQIISMAISIKASLKKTARNGIPLEILLKFDGPM
jgi:hypothetical protein